MPEIPTVGEALGLPSFDAVSWGGFMVPSGTPKEIVSKINQDINTIIASPEFVEKLRAQGTEVVGGTPEAFNEFVQAEVAKWKKVATKANVKLD